MKSDTPEVYPAEPALPLYFRRTIALACCR
jgi:hypothetical protein